MKEIKIITANRPYTLETLINEELERLYKNGINVLDVKYSITKDIGSAIIIYNRFPESATSNTSKLKIEESSKFLS